jgi:anaerobic glycerol-3-phosphate dehydrogenase
VSTDRSFEVVIAGGGVAALEAAIALREIAGDRVALTLVAPDTDFSYRALAVREPFAEGTGPAFPYDAPLLALGAHPRNPFRHGSTLDAEHMDQPLHGLVQDVEGGYVGSSSTRATGVWRSTAWSRCRSSSGPPSAACHRLRPQPARGHRPHRRPGPA